MHKHTLLHPLAEVKTFTQPEAELTLLPRVF